MTEENKPTDRRRSMTMSAEIQAILDRSLGDFEKVVTARLHSIQEAVNDTRSTMAIFVDKMSNLHKDYIPRTEQEKEQERVDEKMKELEKSVDTLKAWRSYLAGAICVMAFVITVITESHFWGK